MTTSAVSWLTVFVDLVPAEHEAGLRFWEGLTGDQRSAARGEHDEFVTLLPDEGAAHLRVQRAGGASGVHLDLHVTDLDAATECAVAAGAMVVARPGHVVLLSPAGFGFCLVRPLDGAVRTPPRRWPDGHRSIVDQLTIDVAADAWADECRFWGQLTGWTVASSSRPEMARLHTPATMPVRVLLQRLGDGPTGGHLDIATDDRDAEVGRVLALGATVTARHEHWTVLAPPAGPALCVTPRDPATGLLAPAVR